MTDSWGRKGRFRCVLFGTWSAWGDPVTCTKPASFSRRRSGMPIILAYTLRNSAFEEHTWATFSTASLISPLLVQHTPGTGVCPPLAIRARDTSLYKYQSESLASLLQEKEIAT